MTLPPPIAAAPENPTDRPARRLLDPDTTLIRMADLLEVTGLARATIYKMMKSDPAFPRPVKLSASNARSAPVGFVLGEVQTWIRGRIAARDVE